MRCDFISGEAPVDVLYEHHHGFSWSQLGCNKISSQWENNRLVWCNVIKHVTKEYLQNTLKSEII